MVLAGNKAKRLSSVNHTTKTNHHHHHHHHHHVSCSNTHHDVTDLANHGMVETQKLEYLENGTYFFYKTKKILTCASDDTF